MGRQIVELGVYRDDRWIDEDWNRRFLGEYDEVLIVIEEHNSGADSVEWVQRVLQIAQEAGVVPKED
jgi:hypothetical protein